MKNIFRYGLLTVAAAAILSSCSDWTEPESVDVKFNNAQEVAPEVYAKYLANLRQYRATTHPRAYAWFANQPVFTSQAHHVSALPDSIDVAVLTNPLALNEATVAEMNQQRADKGMLFAAPLEFASIKKEWTAMKETETASNPAPEWTKYLGDKVREVLAAASSFDRLVVMYDGKVSANLPAADRAELAAEETAFFAPVKEWLASSGKGMDFVGVPSNLLDPSVIEKADVIFLSETARATNTDEFDFIVRRNSVANVAADRFAVMTAVPVLDPTQAAVGYWGDKLSSHEAARWAAANGLKGLGLQNISDDYYNPTFIYPVTRTAIQVLNPSAF